MTSRPEGTAATGSAGATSVPSNMSKWADVVPKRVDAEDAMSPKEVAGVWEKMYKAAGFKTASEKERMQLRAAVYVYCAINGCSRVGGYEGNFSLADGTDVRAAIIPQATGKMTIRKFLRGCMEESYVFFKESSAMELHPRFVSKAAELGISAGNAFATADWLGDCPYFTPAESEAHRKKYTNAVDRARRARGGKSLEGIEEDRGQRMLEVSGPAYEQDNTF